MNDDDFIFISKGNILSELNIDVVSLLETTLPQLMKNATTPGNFNTKRRQFSTQALVVDQIKITPYIGTRSLLIRTVVRSDSGKKYDNQIMFKRVNFVDDITQVENENDIVEFTASDGEIYNIERINLQKIDIACRCNCLDFKWTISKHNVKDKSLYGRAPAPYKPKTDRPSRNLKSKSSLCKHLMKSGTVIAESDITTTFKI